MNKLLHQFNAAFLALLILFSTVSFSVDMHFCGEKLVDYSLFDQAAKCGMAQAESATSVCPMSQMNCCTDAELVQEGQDEITFMVQELNEDQQFFLVAFISTFILNHQGYQADATTLPEYPPPLIKRDFQVLYDTFLI